MTDTPTQAKMYAQVDSGGVVVNIILAHANFVMPGYVLIPLEDNHTVPINSVYQDGQFIEPSLQTTSPGRLLELSAQLRFSKEIGGVIYKGVEYSTDRTSQAAIAGMYNLLVHMSSADPTYTVAFKAASGEFQELAASEGVELAIAVGEHVQNCYKQEQAIASRIQAKELTTPADVQIAWA